MSEVAITRVEEAIHSTVDAFNKQDMRVFLSYFTSDTTAYWPDAGELVVGEAVYDRYRTSAEAGFTANLEAQDINLQLNGNIVLSTCYFRGTFNPPDGSVSDVAFRVSLMWVSTDDGWKIAHAHYSPLTSN